MSLKPKPARERILAAATRVFARDGLDGATTRAIAQSAKVNEVTIFRLFGSKKKLLAEVVAQSFDEKSSPPADVPVTSDLRADLLAFCALYEARLVENLPLIRTMIGDLQRHREYEHSVLKNILRPLRAQLIARLDAARKGGHVRAGVDPGIAADQLFAMIFTSVLKNSRPGTIRDYPADEYIAASVDLLIRGLARSTSR